MCTLTWSTYQIHIPDLYDVELHKLMFTASITELNRNVHYSRVKQILSMDMLLLTSTWGAPACRCSVN